MTFSPVIVGSGLAGYRLLKSTQDAQMQAFARGPQLAQDVAHFKDKIKEVQTVDQLMDDRALLRVALGAFGLDEDIDNTAFIRDVLLSNLNDPASAANRLTDKRYLALAQSFNFAGTEGASLPGARAVDGIRTQLSQIDSVDTFLQSSTFLDRALEAFGLEKYKTQPVLLERALTSDLSDKSSLIYRLGDASFLDLARAFQGGESHLSASLISKVSTDVADRLQSVQSADDLIADRRLLDSVLAVYGLEGDINNRYMLKQVLESDLRDPSSLARSLSDPRYAEMAEALGFERLSAQKASIYGFAETFQGKLDGLTSADALLDDTGLLQAALDVFGLETEDRGFLKAVLESDLTDQASVANSQEDLRYRALADAFGFGEMLAGTQTAEAQDQLTALIEAAQARRTPARDVPELFGDTALLLATAQFFDIPLGQRETVYAGRVLQTYGTDPEAPSLPLTDTRYRAMFDAMNFRPEGDERSYPVGFTEAVAERYLDRQFEIKVGDIDTNMRIALSFERELGDVVAGASTNDSRWFKVMASPQLRTVMEAALGLPSSFAGLDLDRQLSDFKTRAERSFGTSDLEQLLAADSVEQIRDRFLTVAAASGASTPGSAAVNLLAGAAGTNSPVLNLLL